MKNSFLLILLNVILAPVTYSQDRSAHDTVKKDLYALIDQYAEAREKRDTVLLKSILTTDVDQLVSSGEWRNGIRESIDGMVRSSESTPGTRKFIIEKIRMLSSESGMVDARYEIQNTNGTARKMWSTFIVVHQGGRWKIAAIRNMLPTGQQK